MNYSEAHSILGTTRSSSAKEIKDSYRVLAMKWHPDRDGGDETKFKQLQEAYKLLAGAEPEPVAKEAPVEDDWASDLNDYFYNSKKNRPPIDDLSEEMVGAMSGYTRARGKNGPVVISTIKITIQEAFTGCWKSVSVSNQNSLSGHPTQVKIPAGCRDGTLIQSFRTPLEQHDVFIKIVSTYKIDFGDTALISVGNISNDLRIPVVTMILGGRINATMIDGGDVQITIPEGLEANKILRIRERGYWTERGGSYRGDCLLRAVPIIQKIEDLTASEILNLKEALNS